MEIPSIRNGLPANDTLFRFHQRKDAESQSCTKFRQHTEYTSKFAQRNKDQDNFLGNELLNCVVKVVYTLL